MKNQPHRIKLISIDDLKKPSQPLIKEIARFQNTDFMKPIAAQERLLFLLQRTILKSQSTYILAFIVQLIKLKNRSETSSLLEFLDAVS